MASRITIKKTRKPGRSLRPREKPSQAMKDQYIRTYAEFLIHVEARKVSSITRKQYRELMATDEAFAASIREIDEELPDRAEQILAKKAILQEDRDLLRTFLVAMKPEKYGAKSRIDISVRDFSKMSTEEIEEFVANNTKK